MIRIDKQQWQVFVIRRRLHHGLVGLIFTALGMALAYDDRHDFPWWPARDNS